MVSRRVEFLHMTLASLSPCKPRIVRTVWYTVKLHKQHVYVADRVITMIVSDKAHQSRKHRSTLLEGQDLSALNVLISTIAT